MDQRTLLMHQVMLADRPRLDAYDRALRRAVRPGDVVVDVGAGTLVLSALALRHGAGHVYAIEADPAMAAVAEQIIARNDDLKGRITLIQGDARGVRLPTRADVVVSEMMGNLGPEEEMVEVVGAVARRNLRPGGRVVPRRMVTKLAAIEFDGEGWGLWGEDVLGYRLDMVQECVEPKAQLHFFQRDPKLLSEPAIIMDAAVGGPPPGRPSRHERLAVTGPGRLHAIMGYFSAELADGVSLSNFPSYPGCNWAVWIWPVRHTTVEPGDALRVALHSPGRSRGARVVTEWRLDCGVSRAAVDKSPAA